MYKTWISSIVAVATVMHGGARAASTPVGGIVVDEAGVPVAGATVRVLTMQGRYFRFKLSAETKTGGDGQFTFDGDKTGLKGPFSFYVAQHPEFGAAWAINMYPDVDGPDPGDLQLALPKRGTVQGTVTDSSGDPVEDAVVTALITLPKKTPDERQPLFLIPSNALIEATSRRDGTFVLDGLPADAKIMLRVQHPKFATTLEGVPDNMGNVPQGTVSVGAKNVTVELKPGSSVQGKITIAESGKPAERATVIVSPGQEDLLALLMGHEETETDVDGNYTLRGLAPDTYAVTVLHSDGVCASRTVEVDRRSQAIGLDLILERGVLVSGTFMDAGTEGPVSSGKLFVARSDVEYVLGMTLVDLQPNGTFSFRQTRA